MDEVFLRLMESAGVPEDARDATLKQLHALRLRFPDETPARLFGRARKEGAAIPPPRCVHGVVHGECVVCTPKIGDRFYFTSGGSHLHTKPTCEAFGRDGSAGPIEAVRDRFGEADTRDPCSVCFTARATRAPRASTAVRRPSRSSSASSSSVSSVRRLPTQLPQGPKPLDADSPPSVGDTIDWGGFLGVVAAITDRGVTVDVNGMKLTAPWGDRARVRRQSS